MDKEREKETTNATDDQQHFFYAWVSCTTLFHDAIETEYGLEYYMTATNTEKFRDAKTRINAEGDTCYQVFSHRPFPCRKCKFRCIAGQDGSVIYTHVKTTRHPTPFPVRQKRGLSSSLSS